MAQSVSNDALWVKLSEMDKKLDEFSAEQKTPIPAQESTENRFDFTGVKNEIITKIKDEILTLDLSNDSHLEANKQKVEELNGSILKVLNVVSQIRKQQKESVESQELTNHYFNFWFFKVRKTSLVISLLALLILILTLFCMKQQNDYSLLLDEYYRQHIEIRKQQAEVEPVKGKR